MMNVFDVHERFYIDVVKKSTELKIKFNIKNQLQISFDTKKTFENENWKKLIIKILSCASMKNFCIIMFKSRNFETEIYSNWIVNVLFYDIMNLNETFRQISRYFNHFVKIFVTINDKTFVRQIINLNKLYKKKHARDEKNFFLIKSWKS